MKKILFLASVFISFNVAASAVFEQKLKAQANNRVLPKVNFKLGDEAPYDLIKDCEDYWNRKINVPYKFESGKGYFTDDSGKSRILIAGHMYSNNNNAPLNYRIMCAHKPDQAVIHNLNKYIILKL